MTYEHNLKLLANKHVDHYAVRKIQYDNSFFWRLQAVFGDCLTKIGLCRNVVSADTSEELKVWYDLHNVEVRDWH